MPLNLHLAVVGSHAARKLGRQVSGSHVGHGDGVVHAGLQDQAVEPRLWQAVHCQRIQRQGIDVQGVGPTTPPKGVHPLWVVDASAGVRERVGQVAFGGFTGAVEQIDLHGGVVHGLLQHELQDVLKGLGVGCVVEVANAIQALRHQVVHAHADDERLQCDALGLERTGHAHGSSSHASMPSVMSTMTFLPGSSGKSWAANSNERAIGVVPWALMRDRAA